MTVTKPSPQVGTMPGAPLHEHQHAPEQLRPAKPSQSSHSGNQQAAMENGWQAQKKELTESLQRLAAEFDNYKKRIAKEAIAAQAHACREVIADLLPLLDSFELALASAGALPEATRQGVELIYAQLASTLERRGLAVMDAMGRLFDPTLHEALLSEPGKEKNKVVEVLQKGYLLNGSVLRTAKVKISTSKTTPEEGVAEAKA